VPRAFAGVPELAPLARAAVGRDLTAVERLDGDFPDREFMLEIAETHIERALSYVS
jgi:hypothetical protein